MHWVYVDKLLHSALGHVSGACNRHDYSCYRKVYIVTISDDN
jgi:hypothetical protein